MNETIPNYIPNFKEDRLKVLEEETSKYGFGDKGKLGIKIASVSKDDPIQLGIIACKDFRVGEKIVSSRPYAHSTEPKIRCDGCHKTKEEGADKMMLCGGCSFYAYCSKGCQTLMWPVHKHECKNFVGYKKIAGEFPSKTTRLAARVMITARINQTLNGNLKIIDKLINIKDEKDVEMQESVEGLSKFAITLLQDNPAKLEFYKEYIGKFSPNVIGHHNPQNTLLIPLLTFFNHSCNANAIIHQKDLLYSVYADKPIKKGEEIFLNYQDGSTDAERFDILQKIYKIHCHCDKCSVVENTGSLDVYYRCKDTPNCNGRVDIRYDPSSNSKTNTIALCLKCNKTYPKEPLIKKGDKIKETLSTTFKFEYSSRQSKVQALEQYFEHFHVYDGLLMDFFYHTLIELDIPFVIKRLELYLKHKHGQNTDPYYTFLIIAAPRLVETNKPKLAAYYLDQIIEFDKKFNLSSSEYQFVFKHMRGVQLSNVKTDNKSTFGPPDKYFDTDIKY